MAKGNSSKGWRSGGIKDTADVVRTLLSFNGITQGNKRISVVQQKDSTYYDHKETGRLSVTEKNDTLTIELPDFPVVASASDLEAVRRVVYERVATFLGDEGMVKNLSDRKLVTPEKVSPLAMVTEAFEGQRNGVDFGTDWRGTRASLAHQQAQRLRALKNIEEHTPDTIAYTACELAASRGMELWSADLLEAQTKLLDHAPDELAEALEKLEKAGIPDDLAHADSYDDARVAANKAFKLLWNRSAEEEEEKCKQEAAAGNAEPSGMEELAEAMGRGTKQDAGGDEKGEGYDPTRPPPMEKNGEKEDGEEFSIGADGIGTYSPTPDLDVTHFDYTNASAPKMGARRKPRVLENTSGLANSVRRAIQVKSQAHWVGAQKKGKLQRKNMYRIGVPRVGDGTWNAKCRRVKHQANTLDTSVMMCIDYSGSMGNRNKIELAMGSAIALADVLNALGISFACTGFTEDYNHRQLWFKHFKTPYNRPRFIESLSDATGFMSGNEDYKAIELGTRELEGQRTARKIMIVLSDGYPACCRPGNQEAAMVQYMKEHDHIEYYGVGICDDGVKNLYTDHKVISNPNELSDAVLSIIKAKLV